MRTLGMIAIFVLSLVSIVEGAYLFKLSRHVTALEQEQRSEPLEREEATAGPSPRAEGPAPRPRPSAPIPVPTFQTLAPPSTTPATTTLREALSTTEGRQQLKAAMDVIAEEKRQARMLEWAPRRDERDLKYKDRIQKTVPLTGDEPLKLATLFTSLQQGRHQILDDMKAGLKNAEQADNEMDELRDTTDKSIHALLGDDRYRKIREGRRGERGGQGQGQGQGQQGQGQRQGAPSVATAPAQ
ncbi:MAG TPA: hypothetical protein VN914_19625 [Polyangia bacterium]|nr:hypothetical protein [Polyangia bacterium]